MRNAENRGGGGIDKLMLGNLEKTSGGGGHKNPGRGMNGCNNSHKWQRTFLSCFLLLSSSIRFFPLIFQSG